VSYLEVQQGASVIPLGELFTIKRNGKYKFRQIALGNLLKEGKDYAETFASTISGDGIRWFCALAASCGRSIYGWDAKTGYLQTTQRIPIYAYLPSHHGYSDLTYEELAKLRAQMLVLLKKYGIEGVKRFSRDMRKERRIRPKTVLKLNRSIRCARCRTKLCNVYAVPALEEMWNGAIGNGSVHLLQDHAARWWKRT
jgi:hypothetical protein